MFQAEKPPNLKFFKWGGKALFTLNEYFKLFFKFPFSFYYFSPGAVNFLEFLPDSDIDGDPVDKFVLVLETVLVEHSETERRFERAMCELFRLSSLLLRYRCSRCNCSLWTACLLSLSSRFWKRRKKEKLKTTNFRTSENQILLNKGRKWFNFPERSIIRFEPQKSHHQQVVTCTQTSFLVLWDTSDGITRWLFNAY